MNANGLETAFFKQGDFEMPILRHEFNSDRSIVDLEIDIPDEVPFPLPSGAIHERIYLIFPETREQFLCLYAISNSPSLDILDSIKVQFRFAVREVPWIVRLQKAKIENKS